MRLHVFNPDHDEALAADTPYYTPRAAARRLAEALAALPAWWAAPGDAVLCPSPDWRVAGWLPLDVRLVRPADLTPAFWEGVDGVDPWGWNPLLRHRLLRLGAPARLLPGEAWLRSLRDVAGRSSAVRLLRLLQEGRDTPRFESRWCTTPSELSAAVAAYGEAVVKAPWSGSGRGVFRLGPQSGADRWRRARRVQEEQGAVEVEPYYERVADFAAEFHRTVAGELRYEGLSLFSATDTGAYAGNVVAAQVRLRDLLLRKADAAEPGCAGRVGEELAHTFRLLSRCLPAVLDDYRGPLGVDLMLVRLASGRVAVHPCVEINVRRTMGWVALRLARLLPASEAEGRFAILRSGDPLQTAGDGLSLTAYGASCAARLSFFPHK